MEGFPEGWCHDVLTVFAARQYFTGVTIPTLSAEHAGHVMDADSGERVELDSLPAGFPRVNVYEREGDLVYKVTNLSGHPDLVCCADQGCDGQLKKVAEQYIRAVLPQTLEDAEC